MLSGHIPAVNRQDRDSTFLDGPRDLSAARPVPRRRCRPECQRVLIVHACDDQYQRLLLLSLAGREACRNIIDRFAGLKVSISFVQGRILKYSEMDSYVPSQELSRRLTKLEPLGHLCVERGVTAHMHPGQA